MSIEELATMLGEQMYEAQAKAWDEAADEANMLGWLHDYAADDLQARNPYRKVSA